MKDVDLTQKMYSLKSLYKDLIEATKEYAPICTFFPQWGKKYGTHDNRIAVYGRATNGWVDGSDSLNIDELFNDTEERIFNRYDQMQWVENYWSNPDPNSGYQCNRSAFWRVVKGVCEAFYPENWSSHIYWSDICKTAPREGNNPSNPLYYAQLECAQKIMYQEIQILNPKHIVLFIGDWGSSDFLRYLQKGETKSIEQVQWGKYYSIKVYQIDNRYYYLTEHPQGKPEKEHIQCLVDTIKKYN